MQIHKLPQVMSPRELMNLTLQNSQAKISTPFVNFYNSTKNPRDESFSDMMVYTCLPAFKMRSLTFILIALNSLVYVVTILYGGIAIGGPLLEPTQNTLFTFGMSYAYFIKYQKHYQRLFLSLFLFADFANFISCQIGLAVYGSYVEKLIGWKKLWMVGLVSGTAGILLSCSFFPTPHINGSCAPVAYMGVLFGYMCFKWEEWNFTGSGKWQMLGWLIFGCAIMAWEGFQWQLVDQGANLGSFIVGFLCSMVLVATLDGNKSDTENSEYKCISYLAFFIILIYYLVILVYFFMFTHPYLIQI